MDGSMVKEMEERYIAVRKDTEIASVTMVVGDGGAEEPGLWTPYLFHSQQEDRSEADGIG